MTQEVVLILKRRDFFGWIRETLHEIGGPVGSCVFVMQVWNGPKQGSLGAKMFCFSLLQAVTCAVVMFGSSRGGFCRMRVVWKQKTSDIDAASDAVGLNS